LAGPTARGRSAWGGASTRLLLLAAEVPLEAGQSVLLECNFYPRWDLPLSQALRDRFACQFIQVVCTAPGPTLVERYERRALSGERHPGHSDFDTTKTPVDVDGLIRRIRFLSGRLAV
jgi:hypothetical protein